MSTPPYQSHRALDRVVDALHAGGHVHKYRGGSQVQASCPLHGDAKPSLSITQRGDRTLLNCFSERGCTEREIADALGLRFDELWDEPCQPCSSCGKLTMKDPAGQWLHARCGGGWAGLPTKRAPRPKRVGALPKRLRTSPAASIVDPLVPTATYEHVTLEGEIVAESIRRAGTQQVDDEVHAIKDFRQRYADGKGGWTFSKPAGLVVPLWRLPEISAAIAHRTRIFLTEGHKDATAAIEAGGEATTSITNSELTAEVAQQLRDAHVTIVCDRDRAGYERGLKVDNLLQGVAGRVQLALPATDEPKSDLTDHLEHGFTFEQLVIVSRAQLTAMADAAAAAQCFDRIEEALDEVRMQRDRGMQASADLAQGTKSTALTKTVAESERYASRWAVETGRQMIKLPELAATTKGHTVEHQAVLNVLAQAGELTRLAHEISDTELEPEVAAVLNPPDVEPEQSTSTNDEVDNVVMLPTGVRTPRFPVPTMRGNLRYDLGDADHRRGVYVWRELSSSGSGSWILIGPLPELRSRIIQRDGSGRQMSVAYLLAAEPAGQGTLLEEDQIRTGAWAAVLGMNLSAEPQIVQRVASSIIAAATEHAPLQESRPQLTPILDTLRDAESKIVLPPAELLPAGYLACSDLPHEEALNMWRTLVTEIATLPKMAWLMGAVAMAPYLRALELGLDEIKTHSHTIHLHGEAGLGKSQALMQLAAILGDPLVGEGVIQTWNATPMATPIELGMLGILPAFRDESHMTGWARDQWARNLYSFSGGAKRSRPDRTMQRTVSSRDWHGIIFSSGNSALLEGQGHGGTQGLPRRVIEISLPFSDSAEQSDRLQLLARRCHGHLGQEIFATTTIGQAAQLVRQAHRALIHEDHHAKAEDLRRVLQVHVAGAALIDQVLGTAVLAEAATTYALELLEEFLPPQSESDVLLDAIETMIATDQPEYPTVSATKELLRPMGSDASDRGSLSLIEVTGRWSGVRADDGSWVAIFAPAWKLLLAETQVTADHALSQLNNRGLLIRTDSNKTGKSKTWQTRQQIGVGAHRVSVPCYKIRRVDEVVDNPAAEPPAPQPDLLPPNTDTALSVEPPVTGAVTGAVTHTVTGPKPAVTTPVTGVTHVQGEPYACVREGTVSVHAEGRIPVDPDRPGGPWTAVDGQAYRRDWALHSGPCEACSQPCSVIVEGHRIHVLCWERREHLEDPASADDEPTTTTTTTENEVVCPPKAPTPVRAKETPRRPLAVGTPSTTYGYTTGRFSAPAAVLDASHAYTAGGGATCQPWEATNLAQLATFAHQLRLGWGGGETHPDAPQLWLTKAAVAHLGLPTELDLGDIELVTNEVIRERVHEQLAPLVEHSVVTTALAEGWALSRDRLDGWTRLYHPEHAESWARTGVRLVFMPWLTRNLPFTIDDPQHLAEQLFQFACATGVSWRVNETVTMFDLIDHTRPPRREGEPAGTKRHPTKARLDHGKPAELPDFLRPVDPRFKAMESDFSWWRPWDNLLDEEKTRTYVQVYDREKSYLPAWANVNLGLDGLRHYEGEEAAWDGKDTAGLFLIDADADTDWPWRLPSPLHSGGARVEDGKAWVTTHTLRQLALQDCAVTVYESWRWTNTSRYLAPAADRLRAAFNQRDQLLPEVYAVLKPTYTRTGAFAKNEHDDNFHLWRPDWRFHIMGAARTGILTTLDSIYHRTGLVPLFVDRDSIGFATNEPDSVKAWGGPPDKIGGIKLGNWQPVGHAPLADWGPTYLKRLGRMFPGTGANDALTTWSGEH